MKVGRNDPCPCGSGKKYKKCCIAQAESPASAEFLWRQHGRMRHDLLQRLFAFTSRAYGPSALEEAREMFHLGEKVPAISPEVEESEMQILGGILLYHWLPDPEMTEVKDRSLWPYTPGQAFLNHFRDRLSSFECEHLEMCLQAPISFYEIMDCQPGYGFRLRDVFLESEVDVIEKQGSQAARVGCILLGKIITVEGITTLESSSPFFIPPIYKANLVDLRSFMRGRKRSLTVADLHTYLFDILQLYHNIERRLFSPPEPRLINTDGEPMAPQKLFFEIDNPAEAFKGLAHLNIFATEEEVLAQTKLNEKSGSFEIEFPWLKRGNKTIKAWDNTVMGNITIKDKRMTVEVNSTERGEKFRTLVAKHLGSAARYKNAVVIPIESNLNKDSDQVSKCLTANIPEIDAEMQAVIDEAQRKYWQSWLHEKIPLLDNKTPIQACKTKDGREKIDGLLRSIELRTENDSFLHPPAEIVNDLRRQLGL